MSDGFFDKWVWMFVGAYLGMLTCTVVAFNTDDDSTDALTTTSKWWLAGAGVFVVIMIVLVYRIGRTAKRRNLARIRELEAHQAKLCHEVPHLVYSDGIAVECSACGFFELAPVHPTTNDIMFMAQRHGSREVR